jgi:hypothetical protein
MKVGSLEVQLHRTVRVPEGRQPANLPPHLGYFETFKVADYRDRCPEGWETEGVFIPVQKQEALWLSFRPTNPVAVLIGAGTINAVTGKELQPELEKDGYLVCPPQPWLDGWKSPNGTVYQFVATEYQGGEGLTVGEQILGAECKGGGIGIAVFEPTDPARLKNVATPFEKFGGMYDEVGMMSPSKGINYQPAGHLFSGSVVLDSALSAEVKTRGAILPEMGLGKGGEIVQKVYPDPHGLEVWNPKPTATSAIYLISAEQFAEITGKPLPEVVSSENYGGNWFGLADKEQADVAGSSAFVGLKSVFAETKAEETAKA